MNRAWSGLFVEGPRRPAAAASCRGAAAHIYSSHVNRPREIIRNVPTWPVHYAAAQSGPLAVTYTFPFVSPFFGRITNIWTCDDAGTGSTNLYLNLGSWVLSDPTAEVEGHSKADKSLCYQQFFFTFLYRRIFLPCMSYTRLLLSVRKLPTNIVKRTMKFHLSSSRGFCDTAKTQLWSGNFKKWVFKIVV